MRTKKNEETSVKESLLDNFAKHSYTQLIQGVGIHKHQPQTIRHDDFEAKKKDYNSRNDMLPSLIVT